MGIQAHGRDRGRDRERGERSGSGFKTWGGGSDIIGFLFPDTYIAAITNDNSEGARRDARARASTQMKGASLDRPERAGKKMRRRMTEVYFIQAIYYYR